LGFIFSYNTTIVSSGALNSTHSLIYLKNAHRPKHTRDVLPFTCYAQESFDYLSACCSYVLFLSCLNNNGDGNVGMFGGHYIVSDQRPTHRNKKQINQSILQPRKRNIFSAKNLAIIYAIAKPCLSQVSHNYTPVMLNIFTDNN